ncbi:MAG: cysteine--tRNA ligase [Nanoarchaeota archaeon]
MLKLYNTLTRKKENFKPLKDHEVGIYSCGPTVYWYQHIGNMRGYLCWDILKRVLKFNGFKIKHVINVTDVGHLTSDADEGEDKMENAAKREGKTAKEISEYYFNIFLDDLKKVNFLMPDVWPKATGHIQEQIDLIRVLEKKGYTYKTSDGIYFDTSKFKDYKKLARLRVEKLKAGKRIEIGQKKNKTDFALWKFSETPGLRQQEWQSPWGLGYPGWHIECSAMSSKYLGEQFDIHTGGQEHIPVHHTNEIAQSEAVFGKKPWVKYWLHNAWLLFGGEKMSKSQGDMYTISVLEGIGYSAMDFRYLCLNSHYRKPLNFTMKNLDKAKETYKRIKNIIYGIKDDEKTNQKYLKDFEKAINNDLNTPNAVKVLWKMLRDQKAEGKFRTIKKMDEVLGLRLFERDDVSIPRDIRKLIDEREKARKEKNWKIADALRDRVRDLGFFIDDTDDGPRVRKV